MISKKYPERVVYEENEKAYRLSDDFSKIIAKCAGYKCLKDYYMDSSVTTKLKDIRVPSFFLSSIDDPLYGPYVIPID